MPHQALRRHARRHEPADLRPAYRPVLVADRPNHLRIIRRALREADGEPAVGIMTHVHVTESVATMLREWPADLRDQTMLIADNGAFQADGAPTLGDTDRVDIGAIFDSYDRLGVDYGLMPDVPGDKTATEQLAWDAAARYDSERDEHDWAPVAVAQGTDVDEYWASYRDHRFLGYDHVAVGGLLEQRGGRSGAHATAREGLLWDVVLMLANASPGAWVFALGCGHERRHPRFTDLQLAGADGKGWLHRYDLSAQREEQLADNLVGSVLRGQQQPGLGAFAGGAG